MGHEDVLFAKKIKENTLHSHIVLFFVYRLREMHGEIHVYSLSSFSSELLYTSPELICINMSLL